MLSISLSALSGKPVERGQAQGCLMPAVRHYLGLALIPQAGVSIGLAILGQRLLPTAEGTMLSLIILSSAVLYEMVGPACAKLSLKLSGSIESDDASVNAKLVDRAKTI